MNTLPDLCREGIIKNLNLADQLQLFEATKTKNTIQWNSTLLSFWKTKKEYSLDREMLEAFEANPEVIRDFLSTICETVQELSLVRIKPQYLEYFKFLNFPKMTSLTYFEDNDSSNNNESFMCLPNLRELQSYGFLLASLKLPKLQELLIGSEEEGLLNFVIDERSEDIQKLTINFSYWPNEDLLRKLINLSHLTLGFCHMIEYDKLHSAIELLPSLDRLDIFVMFKTKLFELFLCYLVAKYQSITIINLWMTPLTKILFRKIRYGLKMALRGRTTPLSLFFDGIEDDVDEDTVRSYFTFSNVELSFETMELDDIPFFTVKYHFDSTNDE